MADQIRKIILLVKDQRRTFDLDIIDFTRKRRRSTEPQSGSTDRADLERRTTENCNRHGSAARRVHAIRVALRLEICIHHKQWPLNDVERGARQVPLHDEEPKRQLLSWLRIVSRRPPTTCKVT